MTPENKIIDFLCTEHAGMSAQAICKQYSNGGHLTELSHPHDPSDFNRCLICLEMTDIDISIMIGTSEIWNRFIENWNRIKNCFTDEAGVNWSKGRSAPNTYKLMKKVMSGKLPKEQKS